MELIVGQILRPHGIRGELLVDVRTDEPGARFAVGSVLTTDSTVVRRPHRPATPEPVHPGPVHPGPVHPGPVHPEPVDAGAVGVRWSVPATLTVESVRPHLGRLIVVFEGVYDRSIADELRGVLLCVDRASVPPSTVPDEFNDHELVGLAGVTPEGDKLGEIERIEHAPASDLLVLRLVDGRSALVPFVRAIVPEVDLAGGRVVLTLPGGLLDL